MIMRHVLLPGFSPARVLPCVLDVGTNNVQLRNDPLYVGLHQPRLAGEDYLEIVDEVRFKGGGGRS